MRKDLARAVAAQACNVYVTLHTIQHHMDVLVAATFGKWQLSREPVGNNVLADGYVSPGRVHGRVSSLNLVSSL